MGDVQVANFTFYGGRRGGGGVGLGGRKQAKTKFSLFLNLSAVPKKSTPATNFEKKREFILKVTFWLRSPPSMLLSFLFKGINNKKRQKC